MRGRALALLLLAFAVTSLVSGSPSADEPSRGPVDAAPDVPMAEHADNIASYTLRAKLDPSAHTVHGEGTIVWRNASSKPVSELWMHLYLNAFKNQSSVFMRAPIGGFRGTRVPNDWGSIDLKKLVLLSSTGTNEA